MKLFFETGMQAHCFLMTIPLGFLTAGVLDSGNDRRCIQRIVLDLAVLLALGLCTVALLLSGADGMLRLYHLLGILTGAFLYLSGFARMMRWLKLKIQCSGRKKHEDEE